MLTITQSGNAKIEMEPDCIYGLIDERIATLDAECRILEAQAEECRTAINCLEACIGEFQTLKEMHTNQLN